jgi:arsenate reductase
MNKKRVLFLCTNNSCRSQMAEGLLNTMYSGKYEACSAGIEPTRINPYAVKVMKEIGVDLSNYRSKSIDVFQGDKFDYVVTVCNHARQVCPFFPGRQLIHKSFEDPAVFDGSVDDILNKYRKVRDEIKSWIMEQFG